MGKTPAEDFQYNPSQWSCQAEFVSRCRLIKEKMEEKESEVSGKWMTEDKMKKSGQYSTASIKSIICFCRKFPESLTRTGYGIDGERGQAHAW